MYRLFNVLCWLWYIYEGAVLPSVYFITNTKKMYNLFSPDPAVSCVDSHPEMNTLFSVLLHYVCVLESHFVFSRECVHMGQMDFISSIFV